MQNHEPESPARKRLFERARRVGNALRTVYHVIMPAPALDRVEPLRCQSLDESLRRASAAVDGLQIISALAMNPTDPRTLDAGIKLALERISEDMGR